MQMQKMAPFACKRTSARAGHSLRRSTSDQRAMRLLLMYRTCTLPSEVESSQLIPIASGTFDQNMCKDNLQVRELFNSSQFIDEIV